MTTTFENCPDIKEKPKKKKNQPYYLLYKFPV